WPFQAVITAPGSNTLVVTNESPTGDLNSNLSPDAAALSTTGPTGGTGGPVAAGSGGFGLQSFTPSASGASSTSPAVTPGATGTSGAAPAGPSFAAGTPVSSVHGGLGSSAQRTVALVVLLALGALLVAASSNPARPPRSLRSMLLASGSAT
ncbi:MAG: hypothetical protein ACYDD6_11620, partial [Acidimicrobiales bacterium]